MSLNKKAIAAMSGGVDSSVTALLLQQMGYDVTGVTLRLITPEEKAIGAMCGSLTDAEDAKRVCDRLGVNHLTIDFTDAFRENVMERFCNAYLNGLTPNPCVDCNRYIKFDKMLECVRELDNDIFATGHYARVEKINDRYILKKAVDLSKDQSYFLYSLSQNQLSHVLFPLGEYTKPQVREIAAEHGFVNASKKDSQDICFIPDGDFAAFIKRYKDLKPRSGSFIDLNGNVLGPHEGAYQFTIGQRKGLGIALGKPAYVLATDIDKNTVTLGDNEDLFNKRLWADDINLITTDKITAPLKVTAKIRYSHHAAEAVVEQTDDNKIIVEFTEPQRAVTPGQSVVLYDGDIVIGGGTVRGVLKN